MYQYQDGDETKKSHSKLNKIKKKNVKKIMKFVNAGSPEV